MPTYRYAEFPIAQPLKFQEKDLTLDPQYHSVPIDMALMRDKLLFDPYTTQIEYLQKWENADTWIAEWSGETNLGSSIALYNCCTKEDMGLATSGQHATIAGNLAPNGNALRTEHFTGDFVGIPTGIYQLVVTINFNDSPNFAKYYISEPLYIAESHPNTKAVNYTNSFNKLGLFFEQFPCYPRLRVEAAVQDLGLKHKKTQYRNERTRLELLYGDPYRTFQFATRNIPEWMGDKLNCIFMMDEVYIDGQIYTIGEGAEWEKIKSPNYPLFGFNLEIEPQDYNGIAIFSTPTEVPPFVCTNTDIDFAYVNINPAPEYNTFANSNIEGKDRSIVKAVIDPAGAIAAGLTPPFAYNNWSMVGSDNTTISIVDNIGYFQRGADAYENGDTTMTLNVDVTDSNGCVAHAGLIIDFAAFGDPNESIKEAGQITNSDFIGFTVSSITSTTIVVDIDNPYPGKFDVGFNAAANTSIDNMGPVMMTGLTPNTEYRVYVKLTHPSVGANPSLMGPYCIKTLP